MRQRHMQQQWYKNKTETETAVLRFRTGSAQTADFGHSFQEIPIQSKRDSNSRLPFLTA